MTNEGLPEGVARVGFLGRDEDSGELMPAQLQREDDRILLRMPYPWDSNPGRKYDRWFINAYWGDDPDKTKFDSAPPSELDFVDKSGTVALVGCRPVGGSLFGTVQEGVVSARFAIIGAKNAQSYRKLNGMRSEVEGLGTWMNLRSLMVDPEWTADSRLESVKMNLASPDPVRVSRRLNLRILPAFKYGPGERPDETVITERMLIESDVLRAVAWDEHIELHSGIRDLVRVAGWRRFNFLGHSVTRASDPLRTLDGVAHGRQWLATETAVTRLARSPSNLGQANFLFSFDDIGREGVARWLKLRDEWSRAVDPILGLLNLEKAEVRVHYAQLCIGLEALGYLLARQDGLSTAQASSQSFHAGVSRVIQRIRYDLGFDCDAWATRATLAYRRVKHADNPAPDSDDLVDCYYRGIQVFRAYVATRLGVTRTKFTIGATLDRIARLSREE